MVFVQREDWNRRYAGVENLWAAQLFIRHTKAPEDAAPTSTP